MANSFLTALSGVLGAVGMDTTLLTVLQASLNLVSLAVFVAALVAEGGLEKVADRAKALIYGQLDKPEANPGRLLTVPSNWKDGESPEVIVHAKLELLVRMICDARKLL